MNPQTDPARFSVDLPEVNWPAEARGLTHPVGVLRDYDYEAPRPGGGRIVFEVNRPVIVQKAFIIPPTNRSNYRLVFDLVGTTVAAATQNPSPPKAVAAVASPSDNPILSPSMGTIPASQPVLKHPDGDRVASGPIPAAQPRPPAPVIPAAASAALPMGLPPDLSIKPSDRKSGHTGKPIVVIDPGHGGIDPGATSRSGAYEKNIVLALARDLKAQLDKAGKVRCLLTRDRDVFIALRERVSIGRAAHADLFLSLHADTVADPEIRGLSVYTLSQTSSDAEAQALADKENKADIVAGIDLSNEIARGDEYPDRFGSAQIDEPVGGVRQPSHPRGLAGDAPVAAEHPSLRRLRRIEGARCAVRLGRGWRSIQ